MNKRHMTLELLKSLCTLINIIKATPKGTGQKHAAGHRRPIVQDPEVGANALRV